MTDILLEALYDSVNMVPFLFITYLIIEYLEHCSSGKLGSVMARFGRFGPLGGAVLGCVPQCGFSASAANLYSNRVITLGTLVAVFVSTSDEALPILLSNPGHSAEVLKLIGLKIVIAVCAGFLTDFVLRKKLVLQTETQSKHTHCCRGKKDLRGVVIASLKHTISTYLFVLVISAVLGLAIEVMGQDKISLIFMSNTIFQPFFAALVGFIPNCASSVILTQLYIEGTLSFGSVVAGLCTGAGVGYAVLFKENRPMKENFKIMAITYVVAVIAGIIF